MDRTERHYFQAWAMSATLFRLPLAMAPLTLVLSLRVTDGYPRAALAVSALTLGEVLSIVVSGIRSRQDGRTPLTNAVLPLFLVATVALAFFTSTSASFVPILFAALGFGCTASLTFGLQRGELTARLQPLSIERALALDSVLLEVAWILGPLLAAIFGLSLGARVGIWSLPALATGGFGLHLFKTSASPPIQGAIPVSARKGVRMEMWSRVARKLWIASAVEGLLEGGVVVGAVLLAGRAGAGAFLGGPLLAVLSLGSILGGLFYARHTGGVRSSQSARTLRQLLLALSSLLALISISDNLPTLFLAIFLFGVFVSPTNSVRSFMVVTTFDAPLRSQAFAVLYGTYSVGSAVAALWLAIGVHHVGLSTLFIIMALVGGATVGALRLPRPSRT